MLLAAVLVACGSRTALLEPVLACDAPGERLDPESGACVKTTAKAPCDPNRHPAVILELVVDESGSMTGERWDALRASLRALFADIAADRDAALRVGLVMFDDVATSAVAPAPLTQSGQREALERAIDKPTPHGGGTATEKALVEAYEVVGAEPDVRRAVVLLSDGTPTGGYLEKDVCVQLASDENREHGTQLFAVGIGPFPLENTGYDPAFMGRLAVAGGTAPSGCVPESGDEARLCHYQITPGGDPERLQQSFGAALDAIRESAICR